MRFTAPAHTTEVFLPSGPVPVVEGVATLPEDADTADIRAITSAGFVLEPVKAPAGKPAPAQDKE
jgi:hypothetical protein